MEFNPKNCNIYEMRVKDQAGNKRWGMKNINKGLGGDNTRQSITRKKTDMITERSCKHYTSK